MYPVPRSWSKKKQLEMIGKQCTVKPDLDNAVKVIFDAMNAYWTDDRYITEMKASKVYGLEGYTKVTIRETSALIQMQMNME